jgi:large subunit ribosomal protein L21
LLYGWFIKVAYDRIYRGNEMEDIRNENESLKEYIRNLETQLQAKSLESKSATRAATQQAPVSIGVRKDDLKIIRGIGPAIEKRLNNAGIYTFDALAQLSVQELENILGNARRLAQEDDLIAQARELAGQSR